MNADTEIRSLWDEEAQRTLTELLDLFEQRQIEHDRQYGDCNPDDPPEPVEPAA